MLRGWFSVWPAVLRTTEFEPLGWHQQTDKHQLPPLDVGFPLPQQKHDINAIAPSHWVIHLKDGDSRGHLQHPRIPEEDITSYCHTNLGTILGLHCAEHSFDSSLHQPFIPPATHPCTEQAAQHTMDWLYTAPCYAQCSLLGWLCFA